jgi:hypothetical protein
MEQKFWWYRYYFVFLQREKRTTNEKTSHEIKRFVRIDDKKWTNIYLKYL